MPNTDFTPSANTPTIEQLDALSNELAALAVRAREIVSGPLYESVTGSKATAIASAPLMGFQQPDTFDGVSID